MKTFDEYCRSYLSGGAEAARASLMLAVRSWMLGLQALEVGSNEEKQGYISLTDVMHLDDAGGRKDELTRIAHNVMPACRYIAQNFRERILHEDVMMPVYRVKEMSSNGVAWLSKRSGRTVREKLAGTNSMLGVRRHLGIDTGENRLFMAFVRRLLDMIEQKSRAALPVSDDERNFQEWARRLLHDEVVLEIGRWQNVAPNNTLLGDRWYRAIWHGWQDLQDVDDLIANDDLRLDEHLAAVLMWKMAQRMKLSVAFAQQPVRYDYRAGTLVPWLGGICGQESGGSVNLRQRQGTVVLAECERGGMILKVQDTMLCWPDGRCEQLTADNFDEQAAAAADYLACESVLTDEDLLPDEPIWRQTIYLDIFAVRPPYLEDKDHVRRLPVRIVQQEFQESVQEGKNFSISAGEARSLCCQENVSTYTVASCVLSPKKSSERLCKLCQRLNQYIKADLAALPLPDAANEFQLGEIRRALRMYYNHVLTVPRSVAVLFQQAEAASFWQDFQPEDYALMVDYAMGCCSLTLVQGRFDEQAAQMLSEGHGIIWERHPTEKRRCKYQQNQDFEQRTGELLLRYGFKASEKMRAVLLSVFGAEGLLLETDRLGFSLPDNIWTVIGKDLAKQLRAMKFDVTSLVDDFLRVHEGVVQGHNVHIFLLSGRLSCTRRVRLCSEPAQALSGLARYNVLRQKLKAFEQQTGSEPVALWRDQLPELAIKRLYGIFELISDEDGNVVAPLFNHEQTIPILHGFTLPHGQKEYRFGLIMNKKDREISYEAVVRHRAFPLTEDTPCKLQLTYTYGKDIPYELAFVPQEKEASFRIAHVEWERAGERPYKNLVRPSFPKGAEDWEALKHGTTKRNSDVNLLDWIMHVLKSRSVIHWDEDDVWNYVKQGNFKCLSLYKEVDGREFVIQIFGSDAERLNDEGPKTFTCFWEKNTKQIYEVDFTGEEYWRTNGNGDHSLIKDINIDGTLTPVQFYQNNFMFKEDWDNGVEGRAVFIIQKRPDRMPKALSIVLVDENCLFYVGKEVRDGQMPYDFSKLSVLYPLHEVFFNGRSLRSPACPSDFRNAMQRILPALLQTFQAERKKTAPDFTFLGRLFRVLCVLSVEIDTPFYAEAREVIDNFPQIIDEDLGCALGAYDNVDEQELLGHIMGSSLSRIMKIFIISRAAWKHEDFVRQAPPSVLLPLFDEAVEYLANHFSQILNGHKEHKALKFLEYVLAVFRLRGRGDDGIDRKLSLNDAHVRKLYDLVEDMIDAHVNLPESRIRLQVRQSEEFADMHINDLYYALLAYITGDMGQGDITIIRISEDEE